MRRIVFLIVSCLPFLCSCASPASRADYLFFGDDAVVLVERGDLLVVVDVPAGIAQRYAAYKGVEVRQALPSLFALPIGSIGGGSEEDLRRIRGLFATIATEMGARDGVLALKGIVPSMKKSTFGSTLDSLAGMAGLWDKMVDKSAWRHYDVARFLDGETIDWTVQEPYFRVWLDGALEEGGRRN